MRHLPWLAATLAARLTPEEVRQPPRWWTRFKVNRTDTNDGKVVDCKEFRAKVCP